MDTGRSSRTTAPTRPSRRPDVGRDRRPALRPRLPPGLPPDRQPARRRGPHPGGLRPGLPLPVDLHARHLRGLAAPDHHQPLPRRCPPQAADPLRRALRRARRPAPSDPPRRTRRTPTAPSTTTSSAPWPTLPPDFRAAVVLCDVEGLTYEEIAEILDAKLGTVRSRIHRGRAMLRDALAHRAPLAGRARYAGPAPLPAGSPRDRSVIGHLGPRVSALLDGQLSPAEAGAGLGPRPRLPPVPRRSSSARAGSRPGSRAMQYAGSSAPSSLKGSLLFQGTAAGWAPQDDDRVGTATAPSADATSAWPASAPAPSGRP